MASQESKKFVPCLVSQYAFDVAIISVFGENLDPEIEGIKSLYECLEKGYNSMPVDLPGTPYRKAMKVTRRDTWKILFTFGSCSRTLLPEMVPRVPIVFGFLSNFPFMLKDKYIIVVGRQGSF